ncbi:MAG: hypothetical protein HY863_14770 [Chloroflexi bacterium]|nr:hypothetical protein [Chloroflexota bacterium]
MAKQASKKTVESKKNIYSRAFKEGLENLTDELQLAFQWDRPGILLVINNSKLGQVKVQQALAYELTKKNKRVEWVKADHKSPDVIGVMCKTSNRDEVVFFVTGIGNNADALISSKIYGALNLRRELLVEQHIRAVFWLTSMEAASLPHRAPDFWAFRHRVIEFDSRLGVRKA